MDYEHNLFMQQDTLSTQVGGDHYRAMKIQPTEFIHANGIGFIAGNVIKYVCRHKAKGGKQDLEKAAHYLQMLISMEYPSNGSQVNEPHAPAAQSPSNCQHCGEFRGHGHDCEPKPQADDDGWIPWGGGTSVDVKTCDTVRVKLRDKIEWTGIARTFRWSHTGDDDDIIAYKLADV